MNLYEMKKKTLSYVLNIINPGIEMISKKSIYPCYNQFLILITDLDEFEDERIYIRLLRVFTSVDPFEDGSDLRKLNYVREYKLPYNNVLQLNCSRDFPSFPPSKIKFYCFQFVAKDKVTRMVYDKVHRPKCRPSLILNNERTMNNVIRRNNHNVLHNQVINQKIRNEVNKIQFQNRYITIIFNNFFSLSHYFSWSVRKLRMKCEH